MAGHIRCFNAELALGTGIVDKHVEVGKAVRQPVSEILAVGCVGDIRYANVQPRVVRLCDLWVDNIGHLSMSVKAAQR
jgi:hypothetical protein